MGSGCGCLIADCSFVCQTTPHFGSTSRKASYSVRAYLTPKYSICKAPIVHFLPNTPIEPVGADDHIRPPHPKAPSGRGLSAEQADWGREQAATLESYNLSDLFLCRFCRHSPSDLAIARPPPYACGARQPLCPTKRACVLPTAAHTAPGLHLPPAVPRLVAQREALYLKNQKSPTIPHTPFVGFPSRKLLK